jgi:hypothetical protein
MDQYAILLGYFEKQYHLIQRVYKEISLVDLSNYDKRFVFALRTQQFYTAIEDLFKQIAKSFENHIESMGNFHKEILLRMNTEVPKMRPAVISSPSFVLLDKVRAFRHFIRHAYDCELDEEELTLLQNRLISEFHLIEKDLDSFLLYVKRLSSN